MSNLSIFTFERQQVRFVGTAERLERIPAHLPFTVEIQSALQTN